LKLDRDTFGVDGAHGPPWQQRLAEIGGTKVLAFGLGRRGLAWRNGGDKVEKTYGQLPKTKPFLPFIKRRLMPVGVQIPIGVARDMIHFHTTGERMNATELYSMYWQFSYRAICRLLEYWHEHRCIPHVTRRKRRDARGLTRAEKMYIRELHEQDCTEYYDEIVTKIETRFNRRVSYDVVRRFKKRNLQFTRKIVDHRAMERDARDRLSYLEAVEAYPPACRIYIGRPTCST
jgi:hypothetical protein